MCAKYCVKYFKCIISHNPHQRFYYYHPNFQDEAAQARRISPLSDVIRSQGCVVNKHQTTQVTWPLFASCLKPDFRKFRKGMNEKQCRATGKSEFKEIR